MSLPRGTVRIALLAGLTVTVSLAAQPQKPRPDLGPPMAGVEIAVRDLDTDELLGTIEPGGSFTILEGQRVRLRMNAIPVDRNRSNRYPSTRFTPPASRSVSIERANPEVGSILFRAETATGRRNALAFEYEILEPLRIDDRLLKGRVFIQIDEPPPPPPEPTPAEPPRGLRLYADGDYRGFSELFTLDDPDLADNRIGNDRASSLELSPGCEAVLYRDAGYRGRSVVVRESRPRLDGLEVGNDAASSLRVFCGRQEAPDPSGERPAVTVYRDRHFRGQSETFSRDDVDLRDNTVGNDTISSVRVEPGCRAILFREGDFRGEFTVVDYEILDLAGTEVGNDSVSSIRVDCR